MPLTFRQMIVMRLCNVPIRKIGAALRISEKAKLGVSAPELQTHFLCGGDPGRVVEALAEAKRLGVDVAWSQMAVIDLATKDPKKFIHEATILRKSVIGTFDPERCDKIVGFTKNGREICASAVVTYTLTPGQAAFSFQFRPIHQRLAAALAIFINTASDREELERKKAAHEMELQNLALERLPGTKTVILEYK